MRGIAVRGRVRVSSPGYRGGVAHIGLYGGGFITSALYSSTYHITSFSNIHIFLIISDLCYIWHHLPSLPHLLCSSYYLYYTCFLFWLSLSLPVAVPLSLNKHSHSLFISPFLSTISLFFYTNILSIFWFHKPSRYTFLHSIYTSSPTISTSTYTFISYHFQHHSYSCSTKLLNLVWSSIFLHSLNSTSLCSIELLDHGLVMLD